MYIIIYYQALRQIYNVSVVLQPTVIANEIMIMMLALL